LYYLKVSKGASKDMDKQIKEILEEAGWYPGRSIDIDYMIEHIAKLGYGVPKEVVLLLFKEYWNLELSFIAPNGEFGSLRLNVDVIDFYTDFMLKNIMTLTKEEKIFPVGSINDGVADLLVSDNGRFYMSYESGLFQIGDDFMSALEFIVYQKDILRIS
jgi:SUKH-3 immunity protein